MLIKIFAPDFTYSDERGVITQLVHGGYSQVNVVTTTKGARRGRMHYHQFNTEAFYVISGAFELICRVAGGTNEHYTFKTGDFFSVPPYIGHDFYFTEDTVLVGLYNIGVDLPDGTRDIIEMER
ncbi:MAG: cupin domain-containing protein [Synergistaceae bacterium]|jgi:quercetin dioxygenase-like cupin family protein|nr:cupin domain-containing protein [Synergistaceae bacterium]